MCVILVTFITTCMVSIVATVVWHLPIYIVAPCFLVFATLDGLYLSSAMTKVPDGAWLTLCLAVLLSSVFVLWRFGKENQWQAEASDKVEPWNLISEFQDTAEPESERGLRLSPRLGRGTVSHLRGVGIFFDKTGSSTGTPAVFVHFLQKFQAAPSVVIFFHIRPLSCPTVPTQDRFTVSGCAAGPGSSATLRNFFRVTLRHGYSDHVISTELGALIHDNLRSFIIRQGNPQTGTDDGSTNIQISSSEQSFVRHRLASLQAAFADQVVHIVGKEQMRIDSTPEYRGWPRKLALAAFLWLRSNTGSKVANMNLDVEKLIEIGFVKVV